ncbi:CYTH-like domain-containing protein [Tirmania nivea]|nr:CYTH-like domain-containing protein [Tirmania nivea]
MALKQAFREIEQKFTFDRHLLPLLRTNSGKPPFTHLTTFKQTSFHDAYFDNPLRILSKNPSGAIWLRKRDNKWQAKVTQSANKDFQKVSYQEVSTLSEIEKLIRKYFPECPGAKEDFGLSPYCQYQTDRTEFTANRRFTVALDTTNFGHDVGEVEVIAKEGEDEKRVMTEIEKFMEEYQWFFKSGRGKPKGKMSAYFEKYGGW